MDRPNAAGRAAGSGTPYGQPGEHLLNDDIKAGKRLAQRPLQWNLRTLADVIDAIEIVEIGSVLLESWGSWKLRGAMKFAICNEIFRGWKLEDTLAHAAKLGYAAVELAPFTLADSVTAISSAERRRIREAAERNRIEIAGIHWVLVKPEGLYMNHPDAELRARTARYFCDLIEFCADVGGKVMVVGSPKQRNVLPGITAEQAWEWAAGTFCDAVGVAERRSVTICFEPLSPAETNFINTASEAIRFAAGQNSARFKIILDVKAMCSEAKPVPQIIKESWPHFAHFHANDKNLKGPGFGEVDFKPIARALKEVGYGGYVSVEVFNFDEGPEEIAARSIEYLQGCFG